MEAQVCHRGVFLKNVLVKSFVSKIAWIQTSLLVIKVIHTHVLLFYFDCSIVEWIGAVLTGGYGYLHLSGDNLPIDAPCALGRDSKNFTHDFNRLNVNNICHYPCQHIQARGKAVC